MAKELSQDTKFTLSLQTMIGAAVGISSLAGMWFALQSDIKEAKELPVPMSIYSEEYPSKPGGYNWAPSYEQYKAQVGDIQKNQDELYDISDKIQSDIDELEKRVMELRLKVK